MTSLYMYNLSLCPSSYIPHLVQPVLRLFLQDQSNQKIPTQKVRDLSYLMIPCSLPPSLLPFSLSHLQMLYALQLCGASLDDYLHLLVPPIVKVFETDNNPTDVWRSDVMKLASLQGMTRVMHYMY